MPDPCLDQREPLMTELDFNSRPALETVIDNLCESTYIEASQGILVLPGHIEAHPHNQGAIELSP